MSFSHRLKTAAGDVFLALLNATLMLAIALAVIVYLILGRVEDLSTFTRDTLVKMLIPQTERIERLVTSTEQIEASIKNCAYPEALQVEIQQLQAEVRGVRQGIEALRETEPRVLAMSFLEALAEKVNIPDYDPEALMPPINGKLPALDGKNLPPVTLPDLSNLNHADIPALKAWCVQNTPSQTP